MKKINLLIYLLGAAALSSCGYIKSLFPDKEKDYQYTTEIPALVIPADLNKNDSLKLPATPAAPSPVIDKDAAPVEAVTENAPVNSPEPSEPAVTDNQPVESLATTPEPANESAIADKPSGNAETLAATDTKTPAATHELIPVELIKTADGGGRLRLSVPFDKAWRTIDKALSRKSIEVTDRNKQENTFDLHYDPNEKKLEDGSLWDEAVFLFSGFQEDEKEFFVKLINNGQQTDVIVLDAARQPATDAGALNLLKLLQETIKTDFAK